MSDGKSRWFDLTVWLVVGLWAVTFAHHVYGGLRFDSPGRTGAGIAFTGILAVTLGLRRLGVTRLWAHRTYLTIVVGFWIVLLGLYEGGYNHALYVVLRLVDPATAGELYPADSDALLSNDVFFQGTGALTLVAAVVLAAAVPRALRRRPATVPVAREVVGTRR